MDERKFRNGVEESVWVSFMCAMIQSPTLKAGVTADQLEDAADIFLSGYRARLQDGKPSAK